MEPLGAAGAYATTQKTPLLPAGPGGSRPLRPLPRGVGGKGAGPLPNRAEGLRRRRFQPSRRDSPCSPLPRETRRRRDCAPASAAHSLRRRGRARTISGYEIPAADDLAPPPRRARPGGSGALPASVDRRKREHAALISAILSGAALRWVCVQEAQLGGVILRPEPTDFSMFGSNLKTMAA